MAQVSVKFKNFIAEFTNSRIPISGVKLIVFPKRERHQLCHLFHKPKFVRMTNWAISVLTAKKEKEPTESSLTEEMTKWNKREAQ